jgi:hypothetical protein
LCAGKVEHPEHHVRACRDGRDDGGARSLNGTWPVHNVHSLLCPARCLDCAWRRWALFGRHVGLISLDDVVGVPREDGCSDERARERRHDSGFWHSKGMRHACEHTAAPCCVPRTTCPVDVPMRRRLALREVRRYASALLRTTPAAPVSMARFACVGLARGEGVYLSGGVAFTFE